MRLSPRTLMVAAVAVVAAGCSTTRPVNMAEPRRLVGVENGVRVDAQILDEQLSQGQSVGITCDVTNERSVPVAVADLNPESFYDSETQTVTVSFGSEIPGHTFLPRLVLIPPGQKRTFTRRAIVNLPVSPNAVRGFQRVPNGLQVKLHFLGDPKPFEQLIGIPERAVHDPQLADALLPKWIERNETVITNVLPMRWVAAFIPDEERPAQRRRP